MRISFTLGLPFSIEPGHFLIVDHINLENRVAYSFYRVLDVKPNAMTYGFLFYGNQHFKNVPLGNYHFNRKQTSAVHDLMGRKVASEGVTIDDDGTIDNR